jgi:hypothetical protein
MDLKSASSLAFSIGSWGALGLTKVPHDGQFLILIGMFA